MTYEKTEWTSDTPIGVENLQKSEAQYDLFMQDFFSHVATGHPATYYTKALMESYFWYDSKDGVGSTLNADTISGVHASSISGGIPPGLMAWWNPANGAVPSGYLFCDGSSGTYDMRSRFPVGASGTNPAGTACGNSNITPEGTIAVGACTLTVPQIFHTHGLYDSYNGTFEGWGDLVGSCASQINNPSITSSVGGGGSHDHPGTFVGNAVSLDPLFQYLVIIQRS
jgi:hypothetical protein